MVETADVTIVGAGIIGLAIAAQIAGKQRKIYVLEKNETFGQETSSRNSQVIHAGLYYPEGSLKARTCLEGNRLVYEICRKNAIAFKRLTKIIVAISEDEISQLEKLWKNGIRNGAQDLEILSYSELKRLEPYVEAKAALFVPSTGIVDVHGLMKYYMQKAKSNGAEVVYKSEVSGITKINNGYQIEVKEKEERFTFKTRVVINSAGLHADKVALMAGINVKEVGYQLHFCKGEYFSVSGGKSKLISRLVYPVPPPKVTGVGIHVTLDLDGRMRLGPGIKYIENIDYKVDETSKEIFYQGVRRFLPVINLHDLEPEMAGIRPKLQGPGEEVKDFVINHEIDKGLPGLINLVGIESPGITASPAIARTVGKMVDEILC